MFGCRSFFIVFIPLSQVNEDETAEFALPQSDYRESATGSANFSELFGFFGGDALVFDLNEVGLGVFDGNEISNTFAPSRPHYPITFLFQLLLQPSLFVSTLPVAFHRDHLIALRCSDTGVIILARVM
jgi:hypothetical protein